jgi:hypothetical protein
MNAVERLGFNALLDRSFIRRDSAFVQHEYSEWAEYPPDAARKFFRFGILPFGDQ